MSPSPFDAIVGRFDFAREHFQAESITYVAPDGTEVSVSASVGNVETIERETDRGRTRSETRTVTVSADQVADPSDRATFIIGGETWFVVELESESPTSTTFVCSRVVTREKSRRGLRGDFS